MATDNALMLLVTRTGVPPHVIDSAEFRVFCSALNINYKPPSATTLSDRHYIQWQEDPQAQIILHCSYNHR
ncbi:hypothetical protein K503DRAFT_766051 [Rhizopogon vinicolor AM-OR11-026]|uniref:Uncharacterized protein n=1 Tax=Rhizopogon vinicolor AM-OR11-026 TaxID=1314800 RepID=A0A1B7NEK2_9AGAM|nr:hypothetical protein K503DRAFT_766051 [Rhizopogon vinicolor AM-OR11-026]